MDIDEKMVFDRKLWRKVINIGGIQPLKWGQGDDDDDTSKV